MTDAPYHHEEKPLPPGWWELAWDMTGNPPGQIVIRLACPGCGKVETVRKGLTDQSPRCWLRCVCGVVDEFRLLAWSGGLYGPGPEKAP